jgi:hypothetical protein
MRDCGASEGEVEAAIRLGNPEPVRKGQILFRKNFALPLAGEVLCYQASRSSGGRRSWSDSHRDRVCLLFLMEALGGMKIIYNPTVDALSIRLVEEPVECVRRFG